MTSSLEIICLVNHILSLSIGPQFFLSKCSRKRSTKYGYFHSLYALVPLLSAGFLTWNYYVTMPMPASTFTMAVGHWHQVTAEIPPLLEDGGKDRVEWSKTARPSAGHGQWTETELMSGLGSSTSGVVKGSPLQTGRYFITFPVFFFAPDC